jgi:hypothetical protein
MTHSCNRPCGRVRGINRGNRPLTMVCGAPFRAPTTGNCQAGYLEVDVHV